MSLINVVRALSALIEIVKLLKPSFRVGRKFGGLKPSSKEKSNDNH